MHHLAWIWVPLFLCFVVGYLIFVARAASRARAREQTEAELGPVSQEASPKKQPPENEPT